MRTLETQIEIYSQPCQVWSVLSDYSSYAYWNPFVRSLEGSVEPGETITVTLQNPGGKPTSFSPRIKQVVPCRNLSWRGTLGASWIFSGEHHFSLDRL